MELKLGDLFFCKKFLCKDRKGDREKTKEKTKARKKINVELFIVEQEE